MRLAVLWAVLCCCKVLYGQQRTRVTGQLMDKGLDVPISNANIILESSSQQQELHFVIRGASRYLQ